MFLVAVIDGIEVIVKVNIEPLSCHDNLNQNVANDNINGSNIDQSSNKSRELSSKLSYSVIISSVHGVSFQSYKITFDQAISHIDAIENTSHDEIFIAIALSDGSILLCVIPMKNVMTSPPMNMNDADDILNYLAQAQLSTLSQTSNHHNHHRQMEISSFMVNIQYLKFINTSSIAVVVDRDGKYGSYIIMLSDDIRSNKPPKLCQVMLGSKIGCITSICSYEYHGARQRLYDDCFISCVCRYHNLWKTRQSIIFIGTSSGHLLWLVVSTYDDIDDHSLISARLIDHYPSPIHQLSYLHNNDHLTQSSYISHICIIEACGYVTCIGIRYDIKHDAYYSDRVIYDMDHHIISASIEYEDSLVYIHDQNIYMLMMPNNDDDDDMKDEAREMVRYIISDASYRPIDSIHIINHHIIICLSDGDTIIKSCRNNHQLSSSLQRLRGVFEYHPVSSSVQPSSSSSSIAMKINSTSQAIQRLISSEAQHRHHLDQLNLKVLQLSSLQSILSSSQSSSSSSFGQPIIIPDLSINIVTSIDNMSSSNLNISLSTNNIMVMRGLQGANIIITVAGHHIRACQSMTHIISFTHEHHHDDDHHDRYTCHLRSDMMISCIDDIIIDAYLMLINDTSSSSSISSYESARLHIHHQVIPRIDVAMTIGSSSSLIAERRMHDTCHQHAMRTLGLHHHLIDDMKSLDIIIPRIMISSSSSEHHHMQLHKAYDQLAHDIDAMLQSYQRVYPSAPNTISSYNTSSIANIIQPRFVEAHDVPRNSYNDAHHHLRFSYRRHKVDTSSSSTRAGDDDSDKMMPMFLYTYSLTSSSADVLIWMHQAIMRHVVRYIKTCRVICMLPSLSSSSSSSSTSASNYQADDILYLPKHLQVLVEDILRLCRTTSKAKQRDDDSDKHVMPHDVLSMLEVEQDCMSKDDFIYEAKSTREDILKLWEVYRTLREHHA